MLLSSSESPLLSSSSNNKMSLTRVKMRLFLKLLLLMLSHEVGVTGNTNSNNNHQYLHTNHLHQYHHSQNQNHRTKSSVGGSTSGSGDQYLLRPQPAKGFPTATKLQEVPGSKYDPKPEDIDIRTLRLKLGKSFDPEYMSIRRPGDLSSHPNGTVKFPFKRNKKGRLVPVGEIPKSIKKLQVGALSLPDGTKLRTRLRPKLRRKLVQFLWAYTSCPVFEKWRDLGSRFWPRWLKEGHCGSERSCSIPPGMSCRPAKAEYKTLLRWHCQDYDKAKKCRWIPVRHPVVTACSCDCPNKSGGGSSDDGDYDD